jgi:hypothetical protein
MLLMVVIISSMFGMLGARKDTESKPGLCGAQQHSRPFLVLLVASE